MNKVNETEWKYQLDRAYFEIDVAMNKYRTEENIEARNAHLRTAMCRIGEVRGEIRNTHQEPTLKSSEGLVEVVELINSHINLRRLSGPMVHLNEFIDSLNAVRHAISTITPTPETASEGKVIILDEDEGDYWCCNCQRMQEGAEEHKYCPNCGIRLVRSTQPTQTNSEVD